MNHSVRRKMLRVVGIIIGVILPVMLSLWFAHIRAVNETAFQLRSFAHLALNKTEVVIQQVDSVRTAAEKFHGQICSQEHRKAMLDIVRSSLYVADLIYAHGDQFLCSSVIAPRNRMLLRPQSINARLTLLFIITAIPPFMPVIKWSICSAVITLQ
nr:CSS-motif domain-containing protein [Kosakonia radicincitans]